MGCGASSAVRVPHGKEITGEDVSSLLPASVLNFSLTWPDPVNRGLVNNCPLPLLVLV